MVWSRNRGAIPSSHAVSTPSASTFRRLMGEGSALSYNPIPMHLAPLIVLLVLSLPSASWSQTATPPSDVPGPEDVGPAPQHQPSKPLDLDRLLRPPGGAILPAAEPTYGGRDRGAWQDEFVRARAEVVDLEGKVENIQGRAARGHRRRLELRARRWRDQRSGGAQAARAASPGSPVAGGLAAAPSRPSGRGVSCRCTRGVARPLSADPQPTRSACATSTCSRVRHAKSDAHLQPSAPEAGSARTHFVRGVAGASESARAMHLSPACEALARSRSWHRCSPPSRAARACRRAARERTRSALPESLTGVVSQLKLHMRDDTYRFERKAAANGSNVYAVALWKLDRLAARRARAEDDWQNADYVIEFARGKALERLRRYDEALQAYRRVEGSGSVLGDAAAERAQIAEKLRRRFGRAWAAVRRPRPMSSPSSRAASRSGADSRLEVRDTPAGVARARRGRGLGGRFASTGSRARDRSTTPRAPVAR